VNLLIVVTCFNALAKDTLKIEVKKIVCAFSREEVKKKFGKIKIEFSEDEDVTIIETNIPEMKRGYKCEL